MTLADVAEPPIANWYKLALLLLKKDCLSYLFLYLFTVLLLPLIYISFKVLGSDVFKTLLISICVFVFLRPDDVPWLYYANNADSVLGSSDIPTEYSLKKNSIDNVIRLFVSEHKMLVEY